MKQSILFIVILFLFGCRDKSTETSMVNEISKGTYSGSFVYKSSLASEAGTVQIQFTASTYECNPIKSSHLLHCAGNYTVINSTVSLSDTAIHVAKSRIGDLIIGGDFVFVANGEKLTLTQKNETANKLIKFELTKN